MKSYKNWTKDLTNMKCKAEQRRQDRKRFWSLFNGNYKAKKIIQSIIPILSPNYSLNKVVKFNNVMYLTNLTEYKTKECIDDSQLPDLPSLLGNAITIDTSTSTPKTLEER